MPALYPANGQYPSDSLYPGSVMSFTTVTITATETRPNGEAAQGTITAQLTMQLVNGEDILDPTPILGVLNDEGELVAQSGGAFKLAANDDTATEPKGSRYQFTVNLDNAPVRSFYASIPHTAGSVDLSELE